jgi:hypothetical protein
MSTLGTSGVSARGTESHEGRIGGDGVAETVLEPAKVNCACATTRMSRFLIVVTQVCLQY